MTESTGPINYVEEFEKIRASFQVSNENFQRIEKSLELAADHIAALLAVAKVQLETTKSHENRVQRLEHMHGIGD